MKISAEIQSLYKSYYKKKKKKQGGKKRNETDEKEKNQLRVCQRMG